MKQLPVEQVPGHEVSHLPGGAAGTIDQHQGGETTHQEGGQLHSSGVDVVELQRQMWGEGEEAALTRGTRAPPTRLVAQAPRPQGQDQLSTQMPSGQQSSVLPGR